MIRYRPDVDGLRFFAILMVILYHLNIQKLTGGFIGVDVFFVISGYLITAILLKDLANQSFTFHGFWFRRIRRIIPAYLVVASVTFLLALAILLPEDLRNFGESLSYQSFFASNFLFSGQSSYFDSPSQFKPLLHTWSLAIEEQFYLALPCVLFIFHRWAKVVFLPLLLLTGCLVSFYLCLFLWARNPAAAFFLPYSRACVNQHPKGPFSTAA